MHELLIMIGIHRPDIIMLTEVIPKNYETKPTEESLSINGFQLISDINQNGIRATAIHMSNSVEQAARLTTEPFIPFKMPTMYFIDLIFYNYFT